VNQNTQRPAERSVPANLQQTAAAAPILAARSGLVVVKDAVADIQLGATPGWRPDMEVV